MSLSAIRFNRRPVSCHRSAIAESMEAPVLHSDQDAHDAEACRHFRAIRLGNHDFVVGRTTYRVRWESRYYTWCLSRDRTRDEVAAGIPPYPLDSRTNLW